MTKLAPVHVVDRLVEAGEHAQAADGDGHKHDAAVAGLAAPFDQAGLLQAIDQARDVGHGRDQSAGDFKAGQGDIAGVLGAAQDAQHVVLGLGQAMGLEQ